MTKYCIDYGHTLSGADTGAEGNGLREQDLTREVGKIVVAKLASLGYPASTTSIDSCSSLNASLNARINKINNSGADVSVSIHFNCGGGHGSEVFTYGSQDICGASTILKNLNHIGFTSRGIKDGSHLALVRRPNCKSMLVEVAFIDSYDDMRLYKSNITNVANAIVYGLINSTFVSEASGSTYGSLNTVKRVLGWNKNDTGWWYCTNVSEGYYYKDEWKEIEGEWYSFDSDGYARHQCWLQDKGYWYWLKDNCKMARNEWIWVDGECYYFGDKGGMYVNCTTPDGYKVDSNGAWIQ